MKTPFHGRVLSAFLLSLAFAVSILSCSSPTEGETEVAVEFVVDGNFTFGTAPNFYPIERVWISGDFNDWTVGASDCEMTKGSDSMFRITKAFPKDRVILFKVQVQTSASSDILWTSYMDREYSVGFIRSPESVSFESDNHGGVNARFVTR